MDKHPMQNKLNLWRNTLVMVGLFAAHVIVQHRLVFLRVAPVRTDPCDGVNAYAFISIAFLAIASFWRMFSGHHSESPLLYLYTVRSQQAVLYAIFITFMAEIIALVRNLSMWTGIISPLRVFTVLGALTVVTVATQMRILVTQRHRISLSSLRWTRTTLPVAIAIVVLSVCPEWPIYSDSTMAHMLTVAVGALVVFIPMRLLVRELVLNGSDVRGETGDFGSLREWASLVGGVVVALFGFWRHVPIAVIEIAELFIAYAVLGAAVGFGARADNSIQKVLTDR